MSTTITQTNVNKWFRRRHPRCRFFHSRGGGHNRIVANMFVVTVAVIVVIVVSIAMVDSNLRELLHWLLVLLGY